MPDRNFTSHTPRLEVHQCWWGELICGTKEELQGLGLGAGWPYPGEPGAAKDEECFVDPRGLDCKVTKRDAETYYASIRFPDRPEDPTDAKPIDYAPGVQKVAHLYGDIFRGTASALAAAGVVAPCYMPGAPGMGKTCVTVLADGTTQRDGKPLTRQAARHAGDRHIVRTSKNVFEVTVLVSRLEYEARSNTHHAIRDEFILRMWELPRPQPLGGCGDRRGAGENPQDRRLRRDGNVIYLSRTSS